MKRIAILGCENSHADAFLSFIRKQGGIEVVGVYSEESAAAERLRDSFGVPVMTDYADAVGKLDGLIVTARHGDNHYKYASPYIDSGIPMLIDKPITISEDEAVTFMKRLAQSGVRVTGGSSLKHDTVVRQLAADAAGAVGGATLGGYVRAPYQSENAYGGFYFYSQHLVEMVCEIFGRFPLSVTARKNGGQIHVLFHYDAYDAVGLFCDQSYVYYAARMAQTASGGGAITGSDEWFEREFAEFRGLLEGGAQSIGYREFISPVFILNAITRSLESGREEQIFVPEI